MSHWCPTTCEKAWATSSPATRIVIRLSSPTPKLQASPHHPAFPCLTI